MPIYLPKEVKQFILRAVAKILRELGGNFLGKTIIDFKLLTKGLTSS